MTTTNTTVPNSKLRDCTCRKFTIGTEFERNGQPDRTTETTECDRTTQKLFAQGHDAKLVSFLVRAELDGLTIWTEDGGMLVTHAGAVNAAGSVSSALADKARKMLATAAAKNEARAKREAEKAEAKNKKQAASAAQPASEKATAEPAKARRAPRRPRAKAAASA